MAESEMNEERWMIYQACEEGVLHVAGPSLEAGELVAVAPESWCREDQTRRIVEALRSHPENWDEVTYGTAADFIEREFPTNSTSGAAR